MSKLDLWHIASLKANLQKKNISATEVMEETLRRLDKASVLNTCITRVDAESLRKQAHESEQRLAKGEGRSLEGLPFAAKDNFCTAGIRTTGGSKILKNFIPPYESTTTQRLKEAGAICVAKTNMDEFAMGSTTLHSAYGPVLNPWGLKAHKMGQGFLVPGGSSGGSAAIVAAKIVPMALGSDTGGSIRQPASYCGLVGFKPTYGSCSRYGLIAYASSLDQPGPLTHSVEDSALILDCIRGFDPRDARSMNRSYIPLTTALGMPIKGLKVGLPREYSITSLTKDVRDLVDRGLDILRQEGAEIIPISLPHTPYALATYYILALAEASSNLARLDGVRYGNRSLEATTLDDLYTQSRGEGFGSEVKRRILVGTYILSKESYEAYYLKAHKVRALIQQDFNNAFSQVDVILTPSAPTAAFFTHQTRQDALTEYLNDIFTVPVNLAGLPAISVPAGLTSDGLPVGLQFIGSSFGESTLVKMGHAIERHTPSLMPDLSELGF